MVTDIFLSLGPKSTFITGEHKYSDIDKTQNLKVWQNSDSKKTKKEIKIATKIRKSISGKTQIVENSNKNCDQTQKPKLGQNQKLKLVQLKNSNCDKLKNSKCDNW